jgi:flagellar biosynthesis chaperone FliJ
LKKFAFSLDRVREWRDSQVRLEQAALERVESERMKLEERVVVLERERAAGEQKPAAGVSVDAQTLIALDEFHRFAVRQAAEMARQRVECEQRLTEHRLRVMEAQRKLRLLEKLKQRKKQAWNAEFDKEIEEQAADAFRAKWKPGTT